MSNLILTKPHITEKSTRLAQVNQFSFLVSKTSTKGSIKQAVESMFSVDVLKVRVASIVGQIKPTGNKRLKTKTKDLKKAIITLKSGQSIDYFKLPKEKKSAKK